MRMYSARRERDVQVIVKHASRHFDLRERTTHALKRNEATSPKQFRSRMKECSQGPFTYAIFDTILAAIFAMMLSGILVQFLGNSISLWKCSPLPVGERKQCENKTPQRSLRGHYLVPRPFWGFGTRMKDYGKASQRVQSTKGRLNKRHEHASLSLTFPWSIVSRVEKEAPSFETAVVTRGSFYSDITPCALSPVPSKSNPCFLSCVLCPL